jgi:hypothetical protein
LAKITSKGSETVSNSHNHPFDSSVASQRLANWERIVITENLASVLARSLGDFRHLLNSKRHTQNFMDYSDFEISFHFDFKQVRQRKVEYHPVQEL